MSSNETTSSRMICIRNAPSDWDENLITKKFSLFGQVDEVTIETSASSRKGNFVIVEFEEESDAAEAVEKTTHEDHPASFYLPQAEVASMGFMCVEPASDVGSSSSFSNVDVSSTAQKGTLMPCFNPECSYLMFTESNNLYCKPQCYFDGLESNNMVDIHDKWIQSMGRSGSGLLDKDNLRDLDRLVIKVDPEGIRSCSINGKMVDEEDA